MELLKIKEHYFVGGRLPYYCCLYGDEPLLLWHLGPEQPTATATQNKVQTILARKLREHTASVLIDHSTTIMEGTTLGQRKRGRVAPLRCHVVDDHCDALRHIHAAIRQGALPFTGLRMMHWDAHPDLMVTPDMPAATCFCPHDLYDALEAAEGGIAEWILPLVYQVSEADADIYIVCGVITPTIRPKTKQLQTAIIKPSSSLIHPSWYWQQYRVPNAPARVRVPYCCRTAGAT